MMMVEEIPKSSPENRENKAEQFNLGVLQVMRHGVQIVTHIGDSGQGLLNIIESQLINEDGEVYLQIDAENNGTRWLRPVFWIDLYDLEGSSAGKFEGIQYRIYPGTSVRYKIDFSQVPAGTYKALAIADCGNDEVFGINYTLTFE